MISNPLINSFQNPACAQFSIAYDAAIATLSFELPYNLDNSSQKYSVLGLPKHLLPRSI